LDDDVLFTRPGDNEQIVAKSKNSF
jgi:hypothetical protein